MQYIHRQDESETAVKRIMYQPVSGAENVSIEHRQAIIHYIHATTYLSQEKVEGVRLGIVISLSWLKRVVQNEKL